MGKGLKTKGKTTYIILQLILYLLLNACGRFKNLKIK
jgi:hypothetical protein